MDQYIITILKDDDLFDEITLFTDDPIDAFKRMFDEYLRYNLTCKGTYTIILSYVENGENKELAKLTNRTKRRKRKWNSKSFIICPRLKNTIMKKLIHTHLKKTE